MREMIDDYAPKRYINPVNAFTSTMNYRDRFQYKMKKWNNWINGLLGFTEASLALRINLLPRNTHLLPDSYQAHQTHKRLFAKIS